MVFQVARYTRSLSPIGPDKVRHNGRYFFPFINYNNVKSPTITRNPPVKEATTAATTVPWAPSTTPSASCSFSLPWPR